MPTYKNQGILSWVRKSLVDAPAILFHNSRNIMDYPLEKKEIEVLVNKATKRQWDLKLQLNRRE